MLIKSTFKNIISVKFSFFATLSLLTLSETSSSVCMSLIASVLHETGHLIAMFLFGADVRKIVFYGAGIKIIRGYSVTDKNSELIILISGCFMNFIMFFIFFFLGDEKFRAFAFINLAVAFFNLLPIKTLDGGAILLLIFGNNPRFLFFIDIITTFVTPSFVFTAILIVSRFRINPSLVISGAYFFILSLTDGFSAIHTKTKDTL